MRLHKALKLKNKLTGEIAELKNEIHLKNSFMVGSLNSEKYNVPKLYDELLSKVDELVSLKYVIAEANREIQDKIFVMSEYKALISFLKNMDVKEGEHPASSRFGETIIKPFSAQIDEETRNGYIKAFQKRVDALQEEIDVFNYNTIIPWGNSSETTEQVAEN